MKFLCLANTFRKRVLYPLGSGKRKKQTRPNTERKYNMKRQESTAEHECQPLDYTVLSPFTSSLPSFPPIWYFDPKLLTLLIL